MPYKHQSDCYRTINGVRWTNFCDILDDKTAEEIAGFKKNGMRFRLIKHPDGFKQAFVHPDDLELIMAKKVRWYD